MSFFELISTRHSVRAFEGRPIPEDVIKKILGAASAATSAGNLQSYQIVIVVKKESKALLADAAHGQEFIKDASAVFVFCADPKKSATEYGDRGAELYSIQDATIACAYAQLAAHSLGLGSVWVGSFDDDRVSQVLRIQQDVKPVAMLVVGYSAERPEATPRRPLGEISRVV
jgi:nitroreductase